MNSVNRIYLDYAATTPVNSEVIDAILDCYHSVFGNPSSLHVTGRNAKTALERARKTIASGLGAMPEEIIFTGNGSEADNLALIGTAFTNTGNGGHLITSTIEHHAVLETCEFLKTQGFEITFLQVDEYGIVQAEDLRAAIRPDTILVSVMHANNEIGSIQPIADLARIAHDRGVLFHTDAVQTAGQIPVNVKELDVDLLSMSAHKFYGPKGVGALYVRNGIELVPLIHGGAQEAGRRAGTENIPGIVGMAVAFQLALDHMDEEAERIGLLRDELWQRIRTNVADVRLNGHPVIRLPNNLSVCFRDIEAEGLLLRLSMAGVDASMGSACNTESIEPSYVIRSIGVSQEWERGALRLTLGSNTTPDDISRAAEIIIQVLGEM